MAKTGASSPSRAASNRSAGRATKGVDNKLERLEAARDASPPSSSGRPLKESEQSDNRHNKKIADGSADEKGKASETELDSSKKKKADTDDIYDSSINVFSAVVLKAKRAISKLSTEEHVLTTLTSEQKPSERKIKQTHEIQRCLDAIAQAKQKIVDCIKTCNEAQGHRQVPQEHFTEEEELPVEHIKCSACDNGESEEDNDILLCDGEACNRCYHVQCVPFRNDLDLEALLDDEDSGWLCPACDAKYDICWHLSETRDMDYEQLLLKGAEGIFVGSTDIRGLAGSSSQPNEENADQCTILHADLPSSDDEDSDFADSDLDNEEGQPGCSQARASAWGDRSPGGVGQLAEEWDGEEEDEHEAADVEDEDDDDDDLSDEYIDEDDDASLDERDADDPSAHDVVTSGAGASTGEDGGEVLVGKRRRTKVDYAVLNSYLFGEVLDEDQEDAEYALEAIPEGSDDERPRKASQSGKKRRRGAKSKHSDGY